MPSDRHKLALLEQGAVPAQLVSTLKLSLWQKKQGGTGTELETGTVRTFFGRFFVGLV